MTEPRWSIRCHDAFGRDRALTVLVADDDRILLVPPPGAAAVLSTQQTECLSTALDQAVRRVG